MTIVVYCSKTGSTEKYARRLAEIVSLPCYSVDDDYPKDQDIVFFGWLVKFTVNGLSKVDIGRVVKVCVVGVDNVEYFPKEEVVRNHGYNADTYYLRGWVIPNRLGFVQRMILRIVSRFTVRERGESVDMDLINAMRKGGDFYDESYLEPIVESLSN